MIHALPPTKPIVMPSAKPLAPSLTIPAELAPGGYAIVCRNGVENVQGHYSHKPVKVWVMIKCNGDTVVHPLVIE